MNDPTVSPMTIVVVNDPTASPGNVEYRWHSVITIVNENITHEIHIKDLLPQLPPHVQQWYREGDNERVETYLREFLSSSLGY